MTKLSILIELLLKHDLKPETKEFIATHIKEAEVELSEKSVQLVTATTGYIRPVGGQQAASTLANMAKHGFVPGPAFEPPPAPEPVAVVAQTPLAVQAMHSREQAIAESIQGKTNKDTGRPRKF